MTPRIRQRHSIEAVIGDLMQFNAVQNRHYYHRPNSQRNLVSTRSQGSLQKAMETGKECSIDYQSYWSEEGKRLNAASLSGKR